MMHWTRHWLAELREARGGADIRRGTGVPRWTMSRLGILTSAATLAVAFPVAPAGVRAGVLLAFVCTAPGTALLVALEPATLRLSPAAVLASGLALGAVTAQLLLLVGAWSPCVVSVAAGLLCLITLLGMKGWRR